MATLGRNADEGRQAPARSPIYGAMARSRRIQHRPRRGRALLRHRRRVVGPERQVRAAAPVQSGAAGLHPRAGAGAVRPRRGGADAVRRACACSTSAAAAACSASRCARLGFAVTGVDASERNIEVARAHAEAVGLDIDYRCATAEALLRRARRRFDVILNMEVVEHVADPGQFLRDCAALLTPGGLMIVATLNRTLKALALAKIGAEYVLRWLPAGHPRLAEVPEA